METIHDLVDLLMYYVRSLYSAEQQIKESVHSIIKKANHNSLQNALQHHAALTDTQIERLTQIPQMVHEKVSNTTSFAFEGFALQSVNHGMKGLLAEIEELLSKDLSTEVNDAVIIASVQKIEHYEICAYGTALAYARQLKLTRVAALLNESLQEEYDADDLLTALATAAINKEGVPEGLEGNLPAVEEETSDEIEGEPKVEHTTVSISERTIQSPGGRAGTSHRRYGNGESRGH